MIDILDGARCWSIHRQGSPFNFRPKFHLKGLKATVQVFPNSDWGQAGPVREHPYINLNDKIFKMIRAVLPFRKLANLLYPGHIFYSHWWALLTIVVVIHGAASTTQLQLMIINIKSVAQSRTRNTSSRCRFFFFILQILTPHKELCHWNPPFTKWDLPFKIRENFHQRANAYYWTYIRSISWGPLHMGAAQKINSLIFFFFNRFKV